MSKTRITLSLDPDVAAYVATATNKSALVSAAVRAHQAHAMLLELGAAYLEDREESALLAAEWEAADAEVEEP
jgi:hypothetical protein